MKVEIKTPLTYGDALGLAQEALASEIPGNAVLLTLMAVDQASRTQAREDYHMYPPPVDGCCAACSAKPALVQVVESERQRATYFCSLACAQSFDFSQGEAQRREWAQEQE